MDTYWQIVSLWLIDRPKTYGLGLLQAEFWDFFFSNIIINPRWSIL